MFDLKNIYLLDFFTVIPLNNSNNKEPPWFYLSSLCPGFRRKQKKKKLIHRNGIALMLRTLGIPDYDTDPAEEIMAVTFTSERFAKSMSHRPFNLHNL